MQGGLTTSFEKAMLDADLIQMYDAIKPTVDFSDADEVIGAIAEVEAGGHFLGSSHTMSRYQTEFHTPELSDWSNYELWEEQGRTRVIDRATTRGRSSWRRMNLHRSTARFAPNSPTTSLDARPRSAQRRSPDRSDGSARRSRIGSDSVEAVS